MKKIKFYGKRKSSFSAREAGGFFKRGFKDVKRWFSRTFPKRKHGQPFYTSKRFFLIAGAAGCAVAIIFTSIAINDYNIEQERLAVEAAAQQELQEQQATQAPQTLLL